MISMNAGTVRDLKYFEQNVNDRYGTSAAPSDLRELLPEHSAQIRLRWAKVSRGNIEIFTDGSPLAQAVQSSIGDGDNVFIPIHPLEENRWHYQHKGVVQNRIFRAGRRRFFERLCRRSERNNAEASPPEPTAGHRR